MRRHLDVTANTTFDFLDVRLFGDAWETETVAVLDVESPRGEETVTLGLETDLAAHDELAPHADVVPLTPEQARTLADDLTAAADAAERGESMTSRRG